METEPSKPRKSLYLAVLLLAAIMLLGIILVFKSHGKNSSQSSILAGQQQALAASPYSDPILKYLPYGGIGYNIEPVIKVINARQVLVLEITVSFSDADYSSSPADQQKIAAAYKQSALEYIKSKGFDPAKYRIEYSSPV